METRTSSFKMMNGGNDLLSPSGFEVESASFTPVATARPWRDRIASMPHSAMTRIAQVGPMMSGRIATLKTKLDNSMRGDPTLWASVAGGVGFGIGLVGRLLHHRAHDHKTMPAIVIIDATV